MPSISLRSRGLCRASRGPACPRVAVLGAGRRCGGRGRDWALWSGLAPLAWVIIPSLALLGAYRVSGGFFVRPSLPLEQRLLAGDRVLLHESGVLRAYQRRRRCVRELFELFYLLVYATVPLGATVLAARRPA